MKRLARSAARLCFALALLAGGGAGVTRATDVVGITYGALTIDLPGKWSPVMSEGGRTAAFESSRGGRITIASCDSPVAVSALHARGVRRELERRLRSSDVFHETELRAVTVVEVDGVPAYRVRLTARIGSREEEKIVYVVGGEPALVVAFSAAPREFERAAVSFDRALRRARLAERSVLGMSGMSGMSRAASSGFLVAWTLLGYAVRQALRRARRHAVA